MERSGSGLPVYCPPSHHNTMTQQYSLRWNNHQPNFISMFTSLLNTQTLVDVTLAAEGRHVLAHKVVLSACSTYFQSLFADNPSRHPIVILKDVTFAHLRTMVDFMYYGEVNVAADQLEKVLDTAKNLKIKGLTEMPDSTSVMRSQGAEYQPQGDTEQRAPNSPSLSPASKRRRRRKSSSGSNHLNTVAEDALAEANQPVDSITLSSVPQQRRATDDTHQSQQNVSIDGMPTMDDSANNLQDFSSSGLQYRRSKYFKRQSRVQPDERELPKQASEPGPVASGPVLQKHQSYPQYSKTRRYRSQDQEIGSLLIRAVNCTDHPATTSTTTSSTAAPMEPDGQPRASHTPAVRSGPPLSCNFCWNTVDECGRILRRKTQYHCPECRTNLCIVPCFHQYHDSPVADPTHNAR